MWRRHRSVILVVLGLAAVALLVGAFIAGRESKSSSSSESSASAWAGSVCTALATWKSDLTASAQSVTASPSKASLQQAVDDAQSSTKTLVSTLKDLGTPKTESGQTARSTLDTLASQLQSGVTKVKDQIGNLSGVTGSLDVVSQVSTALVTMRDQVKAAADSLSTLPTGELEQAFTNAPSCKSLKESTTS